VKQTGEIRRAVAANSRALTNGRAPVCWRERLKQAAAWLGALRRSCAWLEPFTGQAPKLRSEPLLGRCLAELVGQSAQRDEPDRPRRPNHSNRGKAIRPAPASRKVNQNACET
jgi:hypothetical protein